MATFNGDDFDNLLVGQNENDVINGNGGNDTLEGGLGDDQLNGGSGDDVLYGGVQNKAAADGTFEPAQLGTSEFGVQNGGWSSFDKYPRQVADVNGDGRADIIGFGENETRVALGKADGTFEPGKIVTNEFSVQKTWVSFNTYPRQVADVNGDGYADIIGFGKANTYVGLGKADGTFEPGKIVTSEFTAQNGGWTSFDQYPRHVADVNGDGRADIIGFGEASTQVALGKADGTFEPGKVTINEFTIQNGGWTSFGKYPRHVADVNGDGRADIIGFGETTTQVALGKADGTFEPGKVAINEFTLQNGGWESFNKYPRQVADVNGDGRADIIGFGEASTQVAFGKADGTFEPGKVAYSGFTVGNGGWTGFDKYPRLVADVNGDGRADLIGFGETGTFVALSKGKGNGNTIDGNDTLDGGIGNDKMFGGLGNDLYIVDSLGDVVTEAANEGIDTVQSSVSYVLGDHVENLLLTGNANLDGTGNALNNIITGNAGNNFLRGLDGDDTLNGGAGDDTLDGGSGTDQLIGGLGNDTYIISDASDTIIEAANERIDTVNAAISYTLGDNLENLTLTGTGNLNGTGNTLDNTIRGNAGNNILNGKEGNDTLIGGLGNDIYIVNDAGDQVIESANEGLDIIAASVSYTLSDNVEHLGLTGTANLNATGNALDNILLGNAGVNTLDGGAGNDILIGAAGKDTLKGGKGADKFVFTAPTDRVDRILDFSKQDQDKILLVSNGFSKLKAGNVKKAQFVLGKKAQDKNDRLIYNQKNGALFYDADGKGGVGQVRIATFANKPALGVSDFTVGVAPSLLF